MVRARSVIAGFALMLGVGSAPAANAQIQSRDMPVTVGPYVGSAGNHSTSLSDGEAWSLSRGGFNDPFGLGDSAIGVARRNSSAEFGFGSSTPLLHGGGPTVAPSAGGLR